MASLKSLYTDGARRAFLRVGIVLAGHGVTADVLTLVGLALHVAAVPLVVTGRFAWAALVFLVAAACDALDGAVARGGVGPTRAGAFLDSTTDRVSELLMYGSLVVAFGRGGRWPEAVATLVALGAALLVSYTRARAEALGVACKVGLMSRPERVVVLIAGLALSGVHLAGVSLLTVAVWALAVLTPLTVVRRTLHVLRKLAAEEAAGP